MKLQLNTNCFDLSIDTPDGCSEENPTTNPSPDPTGPTKEYNPANPENPFDEAGQVHNVVIRDLRKIRAEKELSNEQIMETAIKMVSSYNFESKALQSLQMGDTKTLRSTFLKYGIIDGCFPFPWPWWPGKGVFGGDNPYGDGGNHLRTIDPIELIFIVIQALREGRIPIQAKQNIVDWESKVSKAEMSEEKRAACLMNASIVRYSLALANETTNGGDTTTQYRISPWWSVLADGAGGLVGSLAGGLGTVVGAAAASGVSDALIEKHNEG